MTTLGLMLAALVGVILGLIGGGGSILTVPILVYVVGFEAKQSIAMSLLIVGVVSLFGSINYWRAGKIDLRVAGIFGGVSMAATYGGARLAVFMSGTLQLVIFGLVMLASAFFMYRDAEVDEDASSALDEKDNRTHFGLISLLAIGVGMSGGFLLVPVLVLLGNLSMKTAVGTSLLIVALKSGAGFAGYLGEVEVAWGFMTLFTGIAVISVFISSYLVRFVPKVMLKRGFSMFLVMMAAWMLYQNLNDLAGA